MVSVKVALTSFAPKLFSQREVFYTYCLYEIRSKLGRVHDTPRYDELWLSGTKRVRGSQDLQ
jgi:primosomal protein N''